MFPFEKVPTCGSEFTFTGCGKDCPDKIVFGAIILAFEATSFIVDGKVKPILPAV